MSEYCVYRLGDDGHINRVAETIECPSDNDALTIAMGLKDGLAAIEVWSGTRLVATIEAVG